LKPELFSYNQAQVAAITKELSGLKVIITIAESREKEPTLGIFFEAKGPDGKKHKKEIVSAPIPNPKESIHLTVFEIV
jgi:hypothetical protein